MAHPIGVFDSGIGGTSIWQEIQLLLPNETIIYLADSKNAPYGEKTKEEILRLSVKNTELLLEKRCKLIVVACNTATTNAIDFLRQTYDVPFVGIEPAIKPAALETKTKNVGVLATKGTLSSRLFSNTSKLHAQGIKIIEQEGKGLVELIEAGKLESDETKYLLEVYLKPMIEADIDCLVLGCTHYPYLVPIIKEILPKHVKIIDSGKAVARQTKSILEKRHILNGENNTKAKHTFYTNLNTEVLIQLLGRPEYKVSYLDF